MRKHLYVLAAVIVLSVCLLAVPAFASEDIELADGASFELMENITVTDSEFNTETNAFYLYSPSDPHDFDLMSGQLNGVIFVYPDTIPDSEEEALELISSLGLIEIAESSPAYIIIPLPLNGESYTEDDLNVYYTSQIYLAGGKIISETPPTGEYDRHTYNNLLYVIAEGDGATFVNNVLSQNANRIAGILTFGGEMDEDLPEGVALPAYLVNASDTAVEYYKAVNGVDTEEDGHYVNSSYTEKQVYVVSGSDSFDSDIIADAWGDMLSRLTRVPMATNVVTDTFDMTEWVLMTWPNYDELGLTLTETSYTWGSDDYEETDYIEYDYIPESYTGDEAVPLVVLLHGYSEDPLCPAATCGWADLCAEEGFILIAPDYINDLTGSGVVVDCVMEAVNQALETYNIDETRIYLTGFSMGGMSTTLTGFSNTDVFAAIAPMAGSASIADFQTDADVYDLPVFFLCGNIDQNNVAYDEDGNVSYTSMSETVWTEIAAFNGLTWEDPDYSINPWGFEADETYTVEYQGIEYYFNDYYVEGYSNPIIEFVEVDGVAHNCSSVYASLAWNFMSNYARAEDGSLVELNVASAEEETTEDDDGFTDVDSEDYYYDAVIWAVENGITTGKDTGIFAPADSCTRAQTVTFLWRAAGSPEPESDECTFEDVDPEAYYYEAVLWAVENGITTGTGETTFAPDDTVTRAQVVTFIYRAAGIDTADEKANPFTDVSDGEYYYNAVLWAVENGITTGTDEDGTTFEPDAECTRAQIVTFLYRASAIE